MKEKYIVILWDYMLETLIKVSTKNSLFDQIPRNEDVEKGNRNSFNSNKQDSKIKTLKDCILVLPIVYFLSSITLLFFLVILNLFREKFNSNQDLIPMQHFPDFFNLTTGHSHFYFITVLLISTCGIINVWFFCSMLLQRFSVPELRTKKISVHFMFILGIFANVIYIFLGFSPEILRIESIKFRNLKVSLSSIVFLIFILFNIMFSIMSSRCIDCLDNNNSNKRVVKNKRVKRCVIYLAVFVMIVYVVALSLQNNGAYKMLKGIEKIIVNLVMLASPYALYILNAFMNLSLYSDLVFIREIMSQIMEKDYFLFSEGSETECLIT